MGLDLKPIFGGGPVPVAFTPPLVPPPHATSPSSEDKGGRYNESDLLAVIKALANPSMERKRKALVRNLRKCGEKAGRAKGDEAPIHWAWAWA